MINNNKHHQYALDETGNLVHINDVRNETGKTYRCPFCHNEMIRKYGNKGRRPHFAHKVNTENCLYDNYLHTVAKNKICNWFNKSEKIILEYDVNHICSLRDKCKWAIKKQDNDRFYSPYCEEGRKGKCNLKSYWKMCEEEVRYKTEQGEEFVADLFCRCDKHEDKPLFIEIFVTHECEDKKKESGIRIIEFHIQSEDDIEKIINSSCICENEHTKFYNIKAQKEVDDITIQLSKFIVHKSLRCNLDKNKYTCKNYNQRHRGIYEITFHDYHHEEYTLMNYEKYDIALAKAMDDGCIKRNCSLCWYHAYNDYEERHICKLYKKGVTNKYCRDNNASNCTYYSHREELYKNLLYKFEEYNKCFHTEVWKSGSDIIQ